MNKNDYISSVIGNVRNKEAHEAIYAELNDHLQQTISELKTAGFSEADAEQQAIAQMGDAGMLGKRLNKIHRPKFDWTIALTMLALLGLSFIPMFLLQNNIKFQMMDGIVFGKVKAVGLSLVIIVLMMFFDYRKLKRFNKTIFGIAILIFAYAIWIGALVNGSVILRLANTQMDLIMIMPLFCISISAFLSQKQISPITLSILYLVPSLFYLISPSIMNFIIYTVMFWSLVSVSVISRKRKYVFFTINGALLASIPVYNFIKNGFLSERIKSLLNLYPEVTNFIIGETKPLLRESSLFGHPMPKEGLNEIFASDYILIAMTYLLGWGFSAVVIALFLLLIIRLVFISVKIHDDFGRLLCLSAVILIGFTFAWNLLMIFGFMPFVSVPLPFFSYGTFPVVLYSFLIGLVLSVYRRNPIGMTMKPV